MIVSLNHQQIDLWLLDNPSDFTPDALGAYHQLLNSEEKQRCAKFVFLKDRTQYILARALLRATLSEYHPHIKPDEWQFEFNEFGKPAIANQPSCDLQFNLTHTQGLVALAVRRGLPIGIDAEGLNRANDLPSLARYCFTANEQDYIFGHDDEGLRQRFFALWTLKEALVKALGRGISMGLTSFEFSLNSESIDAHPITAELPPHCLFKQWSVPPEYSLAIAAPCSSAEQVKALAIRALRSTPLGDTQLMQLTASDKTI